MCSVKIKDALQLKNVVVVLDQALYAEAGNTLILYLKWECFIKSALCYLSWESTSKMLTWGTFVLSLERLWRDQFLGLLMDTGTTPPFDSISECMKPSRNLLRKDFRHGLKNILKRTGCYFIEEPLRKMHWRHTSKVEGRHKASRAQQHTVPKRSLT